MVLDTVFISAMSIARARDAHYYNPPDYVIVEPETTTRRTVNLQQTNANGYKLQSENASETAEAQRIVSSWGADAEAYSPAPEYQQKIRGLLSKFPYRLDTNFAKLDRVAHDEIEKFKSRILAMQIHGMPVRKWAHLLRSEDEAYIAAVLEERLGIRLEDTS